MVRPSARPVLGVALVTLLTAGVAAAGSSSAAAPASGLPVVASGHRPGPDVLYQPAADAPQLQNTGPWKAAPVLVSGATSYRDGEWLYQDYLYDDHGATGTKDPEDPYGASGHLYSPAGGSFTYPTDAAYAHNAADLVELRVRPLPTATAFRVTLNTLQDASRSAFTVALGSGPSTAWPHGAGVSSPSALFLTWHGRTADLVDASGRTLAPAPRVAVDLPRRQVTVTVPHAAWDPGSSTVRTTVGTGLWDADAGSYLAPAPGAATATTPGGGTPQGVAVVNVGPRLAEPKPVFVGSNMADTAAAGVVAAPWWRERQQSAQLSLGDVSPFSSDVDFGKLRKRVRDDRGVPATGAIDRILASRYSYGQGLDPDKVCFDLAAGFAAGARCVGRFVGQLQPYAVYVPAKPRPARGFGLTLALHSLSANYNQYTGSRYQRQLADRGAGTIVVTPGGRGPDGFYAGIAEADTFETWADVARHYRLDPEHTTVSGYSMGGFGTYRMLARWPDLFSRGFSVVGAPGSVADQLPSLRNTPLLLWNAAEDELVNLRTSEDAVAANTAAGIRFEEDKFLTADHLTLAANDEYAPGAAFLGTGPVDRDPFHVTYVVDPAEDNATAKSVGDHAYWVSGLRTRKAGTGQVDAVSRARGAADPLVQPVATSGGALTGGELPALPYVSRTQAWGPGNRTTKADRLELTLENLRTVTIDVERAGLTCRTAVTAKTDGPVEVVLAGCGRTLRLR